MRRINKTMRVNKSSSRRRCRIRNVKWNKKNREIERVQIGKSRHIEMILLGQHTELNVILSMCRVLRFTLYFFKFTVEPKSLERSAGIEIVVAACPLAAKDKGLMQFLAMCLVASQNMHSLLFKYCFHFTESNLLFFT